MFSLNTSFIYKNDIRHLCGQSMLPACFVGLSTGRCYLDLVMQQAVSRTMSHQSQYVYLYSSIEHIYVYTYETVLTI